MWNIVDGWFLSCLQHSSPIGMCWFQFTELEIFVWPSCHVSVCPACHCSSSFHKRCATTPVTNPSRKQHTDCCVSRVVSVVSWLVISSNVGSRASRLSSRTQRLFVGVSCPANTHRNAKHMLMQHSNSHMLCSLSNQAFLQSDNFVCV